MKRGIIIAVAVIVLAAALLILKCNNGNTKYINEKPGDINNISRSEEKAGMQARPPGIFIEKAKGNKYAVFLMKTDKDGKKNWIKKYTAKEPSWAEAVFTDENGDFILLCREYDINEGISRPYIMKCGPDGRKKGNEYLDAGRFETELLGKGSLKIAAVKDEEGTDTAYRYEAECEGGFIYQRFSGMKYYEWGSINIVDDKGLITELENPETPGEDFSDMNITRKKEKGGVLWSTSFGGPGFERCYSITGADKGGVILAGTTDSFGAGGTDIYLAETDARGNSLWAAFYGDIYNESAHSVIYDNGKIVSAGSVCSDKEGCDIILLLAEREGKNARLIKYDAGADEAAYCVSACDGGYIIAGISGNF